MEKEIIALLVILTLCIILNVGIIVILVTILRKWKQLMKVAEKQKKDLKLFDQLPEDYKAAINHIVAQVLGDDWPEMNDSFRVWQAEIYLAGTLPEDMDPNLKLFEIEALAFRGGWERREQTSPAAGR